MEKIGNKKTEDKLTDLLIVLAWVIIAQLVMTSPIFDNGPIKVIVGIPLVLFIPGYVLIGALFPKKDDIDDVVRIAMSLGLSLVVISILGLVLNFTFGIKLIPMLVSLAVYSIVLSIIAIHRRIKLPEDVQFSVQLGNGEWLRAKNMTGTILNVVLVIMIALAVGTAHYALATPKIGERFTEFYILNSSRDASYPTELKVGSSETILVGVSNREYVSVNYTMNITVGKDILTSKSIMLDNGQKWEENISIVLNEEMLNRESDGDKLEFLLFKEDDFTKPYRKLHLWVNDADNRSG